MGSSVGISESLLWGLLLVYLNHDYWVFSWYFRIMTMGSSVVISESWLWGLLLVFLNQLTMKNHKSSQNCQFCTPTHQFHSSRSFCRSYTEACLSSVSYTHLRAHETSADLVCRLLLVFVNHDCGVLCCCFFWIMTMGFLLVFQNHDYGVSVGISESWLWGLLLVFLNQN